MTELAQAIMVVAATLGPALAVALIFSKGLDGISRNPEAAGKITGPMFVGAGMVEALGLFALVWFFLI